MDNKPESLANISADLASLKKDLSSLKEHISAAPANLKDAAYKSVDDKISSMHECFKEKPVQSIACAFAIGVVAHALLSNRIV